MCTLSLPCAACWAPCCCCAMREAVREAVPAVLVRDVVGTLEGSLGRFLGGGISCDGATTLKGAESACVQDAAPWIPWACLASHTRAPKEGFKAPAWLAERLASGLAERLADRPALGPSSCSAPSLWVPCRPWNGLLEPGPKLRPRAALPPPQGASLLEVIGCRTCEARVNIQKRQSTGTGRSSGPWIGRRRRKNRALLRPSSGPWMEHAGKARARASSGLYGTALQSSWLVSPVELA